MKREIPLVLLALFLLSGCGRDEPAGTEPSAPAGSKHSAAPQPVKQASTRGPVLVVDARGRPLADMLPIATETPNAFETPRVQGPLTGADGKSALALPSEIHLFVRAWDPAMRMFPNNFYEILPTSGAATDTMTITMVEGARLSMTLLNAAQEPAAKENVGLMMFHGVHGAWWPAEGDTDARGRVVFDCVPPGEYTVKVKAIASGQREIGGVLLPPGAEMDLGAVALH